MWLRFVEGIGLRMFLGSTALLGKAGALPPEAQGLLGWEGRYRQRNEKWGRGSLQPDLSMCWDVHLLGVSHAIWRQDAEMGNLNLKSSASSERCGWSLLCESDPHGTKRNRTAEVLPIALSGLPGDPGSKSAGV